MRRTRQRHSLFFLLATAWLWGSGPGIASAADQGPSSRDQDQTKSSTLDEVDDDVLQVTSQFPTSALPDPSGALLVFCEPGTDFVHLVAYLEAEGTYELKIRTLVLPGK